MSYCRGFCSKYEAPNPDLKSIGRYLQGQKRCSTCEIFLKGVGNRCPCCGTKLRMKPRNNKARWNLLYG